MRLRSAEPPVTAFSTGPQAVFGWLEMNAVILSASVVVVELGLVLDLEAFAVGPAQLERLACHSLAQRAFWKYRRVLAVPCR